MKHATQVLLFWDLLREREEREQDQENQDDGGEQGDGDGDSDVRTKFVVDAADFGPSQLRIALQTCVGNRTCCSSCCSHNS